MGVQLSETTTESDRLKVHRWSTVPAVTANHPERPDGWALLAERSGARAPQLLTSFEPRAFVDVLVAASRHTLDEVTVPTPPPVRLGAQVSDHWVRHPDDVPIEAARGAVRVDRLVGSAVERAWRALASHEQEHHVAYEVVDVHAEAVQVDCVLRSDRSADGVEVVFESEHVGPAL